MPRDEHDLAIAAHHEAAHFMVHASIAHPSDPTLSLVGKTEEYGGHYWPGLWGGFDGLEAVWVLLAGQLGEDRYEDDAWALGGSEGDLTKARIKVIARFGDDADVVAREILRQQRFVWSLICRRWRYVASVAAALLDRGTLTVHDDELRTVRDQLLRMRRPRRYEIECDRWRTEVAHAS